MSMSLTLHELGFATGILCFGAVIGGWIIYRHVEWAVRRITRQYVPSAPVSAPPQEFTGADQAELSRRFSSRDADTLTTFEDLNAEPGPATPQITDAPPGRPYTNGRGTVVFPREDQRSAVIPQLAEAREPDAVIPPGDAPPPFRPDLPARDVEPAVGTGWDASLTVDLDDPPDVAAAKLAVRYFGGSYATPALTGRPRDSSGRFVAAGSKA